MGKMKKHQRNLPTEHLKDSLNNLIDDYEQSHELLNHQIQAVINHDILSLNQLIEKQVDVYETLKESEKKFKEQLYSFQQRSGSSDQKSLQKILEKIEEPTQTLNKLRSRLHTQVEKTEQLRVQLVDLLEFAQQQNSELFREICNAGGLKMEGYDADGEKQQQKGGLAVNQKA